ncbi:anaerobic ribonucleoside-triphosphate reductase activating protein [Aliidiomarina sanyensis]|uniref:Anaerobic ribonucleoside-triphosphate reductase activating protein n=1 Tax=Aliidiomarina sanyensis TaxID=1249555 RepID=A0A432WRI3_9GAMM|nr:anaerobic ribonucleoside-triphosphate reductase activating protein [Aliidiomarina sanyensis]RUO36384.1 anaerobic ribonucleoside-triphosphate reductase activating protein [Aliidiomarina sanyensis]
MRIRYSEEQVVWLEVPGETTLAYTITGCTVGCRGCHSVETWPAHRGEILSERYLAAQLARYRGLITCVLFLGGEWYPRQLLQLLKQVKNEGLKTCLYTGLESIDESLKEQLDYLKLGPWMAERGGLENRGSNQRFINLRTGMTENYKFWS